MRKIIILIVILLAAILAAALLYFSNLRRDVRNNDKTLSYIPQDAAFIVSFKNDKSFYEILKDYQVFDSLLGKKKSKELSGLKELLSSNADIGKRVNDQNIFLSFHHDKAGKIDLLWLISLAGPNSSDDVYNTLLGSPAKFKVSKVAIDGKDLIQINFNGITDPFYLYAFKGSAIGSFSKMLILNCTDRKTPKIPAKFIAEITKSSQKNTNSPVNLFVNHASVQSFLQRFTNNKAGNITALLEKLNGFSTLNMNFKNDALMFNGIAETDTATRNFFSLFLNQRPVKTTILKTFPSSTANYIAYGLSDYKTFCTQLHNALNMRGQLKKLTNQFDLLETSTGINIDRDIKQYIGDEFATFQLADQQKLAIIKVTNGSRLASSLNPISIAYNDDISQFKNSNIFYYYFGDPLRQFNRPYYHIADNYIVIANAVSTLQQYISDYTSGRLLYKTPEFADFGQYIANQSNISFFFHNKNSKAIVKSVFKNGSSEAINNDMQDFKRFYGLSYQWSADGEHFFTNMYAGFNHYSGVDAETL